MLDATVVNVSLSGLATELRTNLDTIQWVASAYLLALALVLPLSGWMMDRIGARKLYMWCFWRVYGQFGSVLRGLVSSIAHWFSCTAGNRRRPSRTDGADDDCQSCESE